MKDFYVIEVKSLWLSLYSKVWRFQYRKRRKIARIFAKMVRRYDKYAHAPRLYRVEQYKVEIRQSWHL